MHYFEQALGRIAECKWAGRGHKLHVSGENLNDTIRRVMPDADWVIIHATPHRRFHGSTVVPDRRVCRVALSTMDIHWSPQNYVKYINDGNWDAVLMRQTKAIVGYTRKGGHASFPVDPEYYLKNVDAPVFYLAHSVNPDIFKPLKGSKKYDTTFLGAHPPLFYAFRHRIWCDLPQLATENKWRLLRRGAPPGLSLKSRNMDKLLEKGFLVGRKYAEALALSKVFIFATGNGGEAIRKYVESMGCGACTMADKPNTAEELHFKSGWNFVEINKGNWKDKLKYYLNHDEEREEIARRGYETVMKYHTDDIRARQLVGFLEAH